MTRGDLPLQATKVCKACGVEKSLIEFSRHSSNRDRRQSTCKECNAHRWRQQYNLRHVEKKYGLKPNEYRHLVHESAGLCSVCGSPETAQDHRTGAVRTLCIDHDHNTGRVRGLLCDRCNKVLGLLQDNLDHITSLFIYLANHKQEVA